jgi:hypothetical protein
MGSHLQRVLKNARLGRYPAASPSRRRGEKSLLFRRGATPILPPLSSTGRLVSANTCRDGLKPSPTRDFGRPPQGGILDDFNLDE